MTVDTVRVIMIAVGTTRLYPRYENRVTVDIIRVIAVIAVGTAQLVPAVRETLEKAVSKPAQERE